MGTEMKLKILVLPGFLSSIFPEDLLYQTFFLKAALNVASLVKLSYTKQALRRVKEAKSAH